MPERGGSECGEQTSVMRDGAWILVRCAEPSGHGGEHYDPVFSYPWFKTAASDGGMACL
jgi:hypothetical protein